MTETPPERSQVRVGTLVVFLTMVLVASVAAGVLINTGGFLQAPSATADGGTDRLAVVGATGSALQGDSVGRVTLTVTPRPGTEPVDLRNVTVTWVGPDGAYNVLAEDAAGGAAGARFRVTALSDPNDSIPVLDDPDDRAILAFDVGTDDVDGLGEFGESLRAGDVATVTLAAETGPGTTTRLAVPRSLVGTEAVVL